ncbi:spermidine/putrescine ABC transporter substrate-binding protein [Chloroflexales bacterium ZM16-3]|nr:spermidine/putrescine ABC transporter substrate-binding protein [Chloroflexales bacterium ZM16-3]
MARYRALLTLICMTLAACAAGDPVVPESSSTPSPTVLRIYNWDTYIKPELLVRFTRETGVQITYDTYSSNEEMLAAVQANPDAYDIVVPSDYMVTIMRRKELLAPLDRAAVPSMANIDPLFVSPGYDPGNSYCAPYLWGTLGIGYNIAATGRTIRSWADLFDPAFSGRVALLDDPRSTLGVTLLSLGYSPNTTNPTEIAAARDFLAEHASQIAAYAPDNGQELLASGQVDLAFESSGDIFQVMAANPDLRYSIPAEGSVIWIDNMCILNSSPNKVIAERFLNFILTPDVGADLASYTRYSSPNTAALGLISPEDRANTALYPIAPTRDRLFFMVDVGGLANALYNDAWARLMSSP